MLGAWLITVLLVVAMASGTVGLAVLARHRAQASADLAALSAARVVPGGAAAACARAYDVTRAMRMASSDCVVDGLDVVVTAEVVVRFGRWNVGFARAIARSGPVYGGPAGVATP